MEALGPPRGPFAGWPIQLMEPTGFYAWYLGGAALAIQMHRQEVGMLLTQRLVRHVDAARAALHDEIAEHEGVLLMHDWSCVQQMDPRARSFLRVAWKKLSPSDIRGVYTELPMNPVVRMIGQASMMVSSQLTGKPSQLVESIEAKMKEMDLHRPPDWMRWPVPDP